MVPRTPRTMRMIWWSSGRRGAVGRRTGIPCIFGILTTENLEQAIERAGTKMGNAGRSAAMAALEMASLMKKL